MRSDDVRGKQFSSTDADHGVYDKWQVDPFLDAAAIRLAAMESTDRPEGPLVSGAILAEWAEWADSTRFSTTPRLWEGYATAEVDAFRKELSDTFLGVRQPPLTWDEAHEKQFTLTCLRPGYKVERLTPSLIKPNRGWRRCGLRAGRDLPDRRLGVVVCRQPLHAAKSGKERC